MTSAEDEPETGERLMNGGRPFFFGVMVKVCVWPLIANCTRQLPSLSASMSPKTLEAKRAAPFDGSKDVALVLVLLDRLLIAEVMALTP